ncbi:hypothetical protein CN553_23500 [Bacillus cereus]|uniref:Uncharacterized protein n=1 Tax=Bacillus cereus TaxID=1396 RepID=A0A9X6YKC0_BACCE|nr:hypothetical protein CN553_23500 [Bacillus cereus]
MVLEKTKGICMNLKRIYRIMRKYNLVTKRSKSFWNLLQDLKHLEALECMLPDTLQASLREYQYNECSGTLFFRRHIG